MSSVLCVPPPARTAHPTQPQTQQSQALRILSPKIVLGVLVCIASAVGTGVYLNDLDRSLDEEGCLEEHGGEIRGLGLLARMGGWIQGRRIIEEESTNTKVELRGDRQGEKMDGAEGALGVGVSKSVEKTKQQMKELDERVVLQRDRVPESTHTAWFDKAARRMLREKRVDRKLEWAHENYQALKEFQAGEGR